MFWFNKSKKRTFWSFGLLFTGAWFISCTSDTHHTNASTHTVYPIHSFFTQELDSLKSKNPIVTKTVSKGEDGETKNVQITNWDNEIGAFLSVDLTKPAYQDMFDVDSTESTLTYKAVSPKIDVQSVIIEFTPQKQIRKIEIVKATDNFLYQNREELSYIKDVSYSLTKDQDILLLGKNRYSIVGEFKP